MLAQLRRYGLAGVLAYGLLNTLYYSVAFTIAFAASGAGRGQGVRAAWQAAAGVLAVTWAGSQVTKVLRAGVALALAPLADRVLDGVAGGTRLPRRAAFWVVVAGCIALGAAVLGGTVAAYA